MRVRIKQNDKYEGMWNVEVKEWWYGWTFKTCFMGERAQERALEAARRILDPVIFEVKP